MRWKLSNAQLMLSIRTKVVAGKWEKLSRRLLAAA
jgi:hypothetical protein